MDDAAKIITAIAAVLSAVAWPIVIVSLAYQFRSEIRLATGKLPSLIDRMRKMKIAGFEAELDRIAADVVEKDKGQITDQQVKVAVKIASEADDYNTELLLQMDRLCLEYDSLRRTMPAGRVRTQGMTKVVVRMRGLSPALIGSIEVYKSSGSPGSRLAAVAMMQMDPNACDLPWLAKRFEQETPFVFYHASLALQNLANRPFSRAAHDQLREVAQRSLNTVNDFEGVPDQSTIEVLESIISSIPQ